MAELQDEVKELFDTKFEFDKSDEWILPSVDALFSEENWYDVRLMDIKKDLNETKAMLNDMGLEWHTHTSKIDKAAKVRTSIKDSVKPLFFSNAWCKFIEIVSTFDLLPSGNKSSITSFHLCEAPGGFIAALHHYLCSKFEAKFKWKWYANTLNPYYEGHSVKRAVVDDRLLFRTMDKWYFGTDNTGDILNMNYHSDVRHFLFQKYSADLITADGGIDCMENPGEQESVVASLKLAEALLALDNLNVGGCCVLKRYTLLESSSVCTMYILNCVFDKVYVFKPVTSKSGNSEVYVICLGYMGKNKVAPFISKMRIHIENLDNWAMIPLSLIPATFIDQMEKCNRMFADHQICAIKENLNLFSHMTNEQQRHISEMQILCVKLYFQKFDLKRLDAYDSRLTGGKKFSRTSYGPYVSNLKSLYFKTTASSYSEQQMKRNMVWVDHLLDIERRLNDCFPENKKRKMETENSWFHVWKVTQNVKNLHDGWIVTGKKFSVIKNSKFCNPLLLYLWNEISHSEQVRNIKFGTEPHYNWEWNSSQCLVQQSGALQQCEVLIFMDPYNSDNYLLQGLKFVCGNNVKAFLWKSPEDTTVKFEDQCKTFILDTTTWGVNSLNQEMEIKSKLINSLHNIIKCLNSGDCLVICIQSFLTRFTAGVLFVILSLFSAVSPLLPEPLSPPSSGQLWILSDFQNPWWKDTVLSYLSFILDFEKETKVVLEIVPMYELCASHFFDVLLEQNNHSLIQRLRSLIAVSKIQMKNGTGTT